MQSMPCWLPVWGAVPAPGATPEIAKLAREAGALVVAVVTKPFSREGKQRADKGIQELLLPVDSLIVIPNDRLIGISGKGMSLLAAFKPADELLLQAVQGIVEIINELGHINMAAAIT